MSDTTQNQPIAKAELCSEATPMSRQGTSQQQRTSRFEKFASTQAAGDGIQGDALKKHKTVAEAIGANMVDRK